MGRSLDALADKWARRPPSTIHADADSMMFTIHARCLLLTALGSLAPSQAERARSAQGRLLLQVRAGRPAMVAPASAIPAACRQKTCHLRAPLRVAVPTGCGQAAEGRPFGQRARVAEPLVPERARYGGSSPANCPGARITWPREHCCDGKLG